jgi:hypothetical protein
MPFGVISFQSAPGLKRANTGAELSASAFVTFNKDTLQRGRARNPMLAERRERVNGNLRPHFFLPRSRPRLPCRTMGPGRAVNPTTPARPLNNVLPKFKGRGRLRE